jgi:acyl carrier protein
MRKEIQRVLIGEMNYESKIIYLLDRYSFRLSDKISKQLDKYTEKSKAKPKLKGGGTGAEVKLAGKKDGDYKETEKVLAQICKEILGFEEINIHDSFFELGADSIILTRIHAEVEKQFPGKVSVTDIFEYPTVSRLSQYIIDQGGETVTAVKDTDIDNELISMFDEMGKGNLSVEQILENISKI